MADLQRFLADKRLRKLAVSQREVADLFRVVDRDLADAKIDAVSVDRRFATAYNAALQLATILVRSEGLRTAGVGHHHTTIMCVPVVLGEQFRQTADYLDACRSKRNTVDYDGIGVATASDVAELLDESERLRNAVVRWLEVAHPELVAL